MTGARWTVGIGLLAAALLTTGCSDDGGSASSREPRPPSSPSPTSVEKPSAPTPPPDALAETDVAAAEFVRHWFASLNHAYATGETAALEAASHPQCGTCSNFLTEIEDARGAGQVHEGGAITVTVAVAPPVTPDVPVDVSTRISQAEMNVVDGDSGEVVDSWAGEDLTLIVRVERSGSGWVVRAIASEEELSGS